MELPFRISKSFFHSDKNNSIALKKLCNQQQGWSGVVRQYTKQTTVTLSACDFEKSWMDVYLKFSLSFQNCFLVNNMHSLEINRPLRKSSQSLIFGIFITHAFMMLFSLIFLYTSHLFQSSFSILSLLYCSILLVLYHPAIILLFIKGMSVKYHTSFLLYLFFRWLGLVSVLSLTTIFSSHTHIIFLCFPHLYCHVLAVLLWFIISVLGYQKM